MVFPQDVAAFYKERRAGNLAIGFAVGGFALGVMFYTMYKMNADEFKNVFAPEVLNKNKSPRSN